MVSAFEYKKNICFAFYLVRFFDLPEAEGWLADDHAKWLFPEKSNGLGWVDDYFFLSSLSAKNNQFNMLLPLFAVFHHTS